MKFDKSINEAYWRNMSEEHLNNFINEIFNYYRDNGFPYYSTNMDDRQKDFNSLIKFDRGTLFEDDTIKQTMHGLGLAWSYFPHSFDVKCGNKITPYEAFMNDDTFKKVIKKRLKMGSYLSDSGIRKMLKIYSGVQGVSNFRPTAAAAIYDRFGKDGVVWDMSSGWGGRFLGAVASGVKTYIGTEPSIKTFEGLNKLVTDFGTTIETKLYCLGSEEFRPDYGSLDVCFTSPPYFDLEKYSDDESQSYLKFPNKNIWIEEFLRKTFENCYYGLKDYGVMLINIADIKGHELELDMVRVAEEVGFRKIKKLKLALSNINLRDKTNKFKYEPIYLFIK